MVFAFFSQQDAERAGYSVAYIEENSKSKYMGDKKTIRKEILYTATSSDKTASEYKWPDREKVWAGKLSDLHFVKTVKKSHGNAIYSF